MSLNQLRRLRKYQTSNEHTPEEDAFGEIDPKHDIDDDQHQNRGFAQQFGNPDEEADLRQVKDRQLQFQEAGSFEKGPGQHTDFRNQKQKLAQRRQETSSSNEMDQLIDLSNIQNISDLNALAGIDTGYGKKGKNLDGRRITDSPGQDEVDVDQIEVDLDENEIEEIERIMRRQNNGGRSADTPEDTDLMSRDQRLAFGVHGLAVETPPSDFGFDGQDDDNDMVAGLDQEAAKRMRKLEQQKKFQQSQHQQIQKELRELLAQSSSEQLLLINDENEKINSSASAGREGEQDPRQRWQEAREIGDDKGAAAQERAQEAANTGQRPHQNGNMTEDIEIGSSNAVSKGSSLQGSEKAKSGLGGSRPNAATPVGEGSLTPSAAKLDFEVAQQRILQPHTQQQISATEELAAAGRRLADPLEADLRGQKKKGGSKDLDRLAIDKAEQAHAAEAKEAKEGGDENDSFHRLYNKEIKVNQDEIPLLLLELTDIAYKFIKKDQFEKAYVLLQKTESVLEVVNLEHSKRDRYFAYITYHNMAMCFQKLGMLEECIIYLKETIAVIEKSNFFKDVSISHRMKQMQMQCQLKLQLCAILSQTQKHTEAMENAKLSVRLGHQILRDMYDLCVFYSNKIKFKDDFASLSLLLMDEIEGDSQNRTSKEGDEAKKGAKHTKSELNDKMMHKQYIRENSPVRDIPFNILEESISMIERTALKLLPIMKELGNRLAGINGKRGPQAFHATATALNTDGTPLSDRDVENERKALEKKLKEKAQGKSKNLLGSDDEEAAEDIKDVDLQVDSKRNRASPKHSATIEKKEGDQIDMRTVLGFLNQNEWILNLNIGNIMQIQPVRMKDFMQSYRNEHQLSRESFLEKLQLLIVSYFCVSTEMRFIVQSRAGFMKAEVKKEKELEQEYWHVKALDIACAFLPSECPLFNHILLSYQKHHDPTMQPINEDEEQEDVITVLRPLKGIENSKYQPLVRELNNVYIDIAEVPMSPLSKCFDQRLLPKRVKTASTNVQTDKIEQPERPVMLSQSVSVQEDLRREDEEQRERERKRNEKTCQDSQTSTDLFDPNNAYVDLSTSKYEEHLMTKIIDDPKINDKQQFLSKLISRVQSEEPEKFMKGSTIHYGNNLTDMTYANTQSQNLNILHSHMVSYQQPNGAESHQTLKGTLTAEPSQEAPYGGKRHQQLANKGSKNTQSGQLHYKAGGGRTGSRGPPVNNNFDPIDFKSFDQKSQVFNHVRSLYGDATSNEATTIGYGAKHHIASQSLAPSQSVFTEQHLGGLSKSKNAAAKQSQQLISHKKNQSVSGGNSEDIFRKGGNSKTKQTIEHSTHQRNFNHSVNSNSMVSTKHGVTKKKQKSSDARTSQGLNKNLLSGQNEKIKIQSSGANKLLTGVKADKYHSNINLSNQKNQATRSKPSKYLQNNSYVGQRSDSKERVPGPQGGPRGGAANPRPGPTYQKTSLSNPRQGKISQGSQAPFSQTSKVHRIPTAVGKNQDYLLKELNDVMSQSSVNDSNPDPDLHPQPESSCSDTGGLQGKSPMQMLQPKEVVTQPDESAGLSDSNTNKGAVDLGLPRDRTQGAAGVGKEGSQKTAPMRPSSAITNYTSGTHGGAQSGVKGKHSKQRLQNVQSLNRSQMKATKLQQQQQNIVTLAKQGKQKQLYSGAPLVPKKKTKVLSRKKYGSDRSSNSPEQASRLGTQDNMGGGNLAPHGYSIAQHPGYSIFDSGNTHSISKLSNQQQSKQSISNFGHAEAVAGAQSRGNGKNERILRNNEHLLRKKSKGAQLPQHSNSQTLQVDKKLKQLPKAPGKTEMTIANNQSENILAKLQNLLQNKEEDKKDMQQRLDKRSQNLAQQQLALKNQNSQQQNYSNSMQRKYANSNGSLRQSRQSQQSKYSRSKSRVSRSKSSGNGRSAGERAQSRSREGRETNPRERNLKSASNDRSALVNRSHLDGPTNNSLLFQSQNYADSQNDPNERQYQSSFEMNQLFSDAPQQDGAKKRKAPRGVQALRNRPKSSMLFDNPLQKESLQQQFAGVAGNQVRGSQQGSQGPKKANKAARKAPAAQKQGGHNSSIENLQRQVLENQKILMNIHAQNNTRGSHKQTKRNSGYLGRHNHNNSISHMSSNQASMGGNILPLSHQKSQMQTQNLRNQINGTANKSILSSGQSASGVSRVSNQKKSQTRKQQQLQGTGASVQSQAQNILNSYNTSQILNCLAANMQNIQKSDLKNQQNMTQNIKSTSASTTNGAQYSHGKTGKQRKASSKQNRSSLSNNFMTQNSAGNPTNGFVNFEQMQQQLGGATPEQIGGLTLGAVDLSTQDGRQLNQQQIEQAQTMLMQMQHMNDVSTSGQQNQLNFIPHKNLMPKTTGSQAHLLSIQEANNLQKYNSLNQTGRISGRVKNSKKQNVKQNN